MKTNLSGQWKGTIVYSEDYVDLEGEELYFTLEITESAGTFKGIAWDTGGVGVNPDKATVKGFVEGDEISFLKQYGSTLIYENGKETLEKDKPSAEVNYWGTIDREANRVEGHWEIIVDSQKAGDGWFDDIITGSFTMQKV